MADATHRMLSTSIWNSGRKEPSSVDNILDTEKEIANEIVVGNGTKHSSRVESFAAIGYFFSRFRQEKGVIIAGISRHTGTHNPWNRGE